MENNGRRTKIEMVKAIFLYLQKSGKPGHGSSIYKISRHTKINPISVKSWINLIEYIQNRPKIFPVRSETKRGEQVMVTTEDFFGNKS